MRAGGGGSHVDNEVDHGVAQHLFAGILHSLCYRQLPHDPTRNMQTIWIRMQELYKEAGIAEKLSRFSLKMFTDPDSPHATFPKLTNAIKATLQISDQLRTDARWSHIPSNVRVYTQRFIILVAI
jgi:hypothetical protein